MKKILIFEYITGGGLIEKKVDNNLLFEAETILNSLIETSNYQVNFFCDYRHRFRHKEGAIVVSKNNPGIIYNSKFINEYDFYLPICPETHLIYYTYVKNIAHTVNNMNLSCTKTILTTSDKLTFRQICNKKNISNPDSFDTSKSNQLYIEKDRTSCGCINTRIVKDNQTQTKDKIIEKYIPGQSYSISLHISHKRYNIMSVSYTHLRAHET